MRNLTLKRNRKFTGSLAKLKVYLEDPDFSELEIAGVPCRKLGEVKNGEEKTFEIDEKERRVFVIADQASKEYCNDFYRVPAGEADVYLSGQCRLNPAVGNAFRFDNNDSMEVLENRSMQKRRGSGVMWIAIIVGILIGLVIGFFAFQDLFRPHEAKAQVFSGAGMNIVLTDEFWTVEEETAKENGFDIIFDSDHIGVMAWKDAFTVLDEWGSWTPRDYAGNLILDAAIDAERVEEVDGLTRFAYEETGDDGVLYRYYSYVYKTDSAFWLVQFAAAEAEADQYEAQIREYAKTVTFE